MRFLQLVAAFLLLAPLASAQVIYGSLVGNVRDSSDASVPGAAVRVTQTGTKLVREATTNEAGQYLFPTLPSGTYDVEVTKDGFAPFTRRALEITINSVVRVEVVLKPGTVTETIQVTAEAAVLQTDRAEVRAEVSGKTLENIPLPPGRHY
ncbi:MAG: carboxypeptidase-like regulatory domain-containing protein, partial [Gammaproteobacteria bacterium]